MNARFAYVYAERYINTRGGFSKDNNWQVTSHIPRTPPSDLTFSFHSHLSEVVMNSLPQELFREILSYLLLDDKKSLRNCSLVVKSWVNISQEFLFKSIETGSGQLKSWLDRISISQRKVVLLGYVRRLTFEREELGQMDETLRDHFRFLKLKHLTMLSTYVTRMRPDMEVFSAFKGTLLSITISECYASKSGLIPLINYFPKL